MFTQNVPPQRGSGAGPGILSNSQLRPMPALGHALAVGHSALLLAVRGPVAEAGAAQRIDGLLDEAREIQREITLRPAVRLQDAAMKLRRHLSPRSPRGCWPGY